MIRTRVKSCFAALAALFILLPLAHALAEDGVVENLRFGVHSDKTRIVLDMSQRTEYRAFTLSDPYRVVIDFPHLDWRDERDRGQGVGLVEMFRTGRFDAETTRLVLDTEGPTLIRDIFFLPPAEGEENARFVLDLAPTTAAHYAEAGRQEHGNLSAQPVTPANVPPLATPPDRARKLIVIDAGHGGIDPGAIAVNGTYERDITLSVARRLREALEDTGRYEVILTRDEDVYVGLRERVRRARAVQADLFISLHADSIGTNSVHGVSVYTISETASDAESAALAARENRSDAIAGIDLDAEYDDVADILIDLTMRETNNQSKRFANMLVEDIANDGITTLQNTHRYAGFAVLKAPDIPSVLVEMGYLSNNQEARMLTTDGYQRRIARSLASGIDRYFNWLEVAQRY